MTRRTELGRIVVVLGPSPEAVDRLGDALARSMGAEACTPVADAMSVAGVDAIGSAYDQGRTTIIGAPQDADLLSRIGPAFAPRAVSVIRLLPDTGADRRLTGFIATVSTDLPLNSQIQQAIELVDDGRAHEFHRTTGRIIPVSAEGRVLLVEGFASGGCGQPFWSAIGGGIEPGESPAEAAVRELREEVAIAVALDTVQAVTCDRVEFEHCGWRFVQEQHYFTVRVDESTPLDLGGMEAEERATTLQVAWVLPDDVGTALPAAENLAHVCAQAMMTDPGHQRVYCMPMG